MNDLMFDSSSTFLYVTMIGYKDMVDWISIFIRYIQVYVQNQFRAKSSAFERILA